METAQIKFFPIKFIQSIEKLEELYYMQAEIRNFYVSLFRDCKTDYEYYARKYQMHRRLRSHIGLIKND